MSAILTPEEAARQNEIRVLLHKAETLWREGDRGRWPEAWLACEAAAALCPPEARQAAPAAAGGGESAGGAEGIDLFAAARASTWLMRGRLLVARETAESAVEGVRCFDRAILRLKALPGGGGAELAITWMNRGGALLRLGAPETVREAVASYEQAIAQLGEAPPRELLNALGAAWMNRGIGLQALGGDEAARAEAGRSLERAVAILEPLAAEQPVVRRNLAAAWAARADLAAARGDAAGCVDAAGRAAGIFRPLLGDDSPEVRAEFASILLHLSQAARLGGDAAGALAAAREALSLLAADEARDLACARQALRARHAACAALGGLIAGSGGAGPADARVAEAGDLAEEGLDLIDAHGEAGVAALAGEGARLFEFGAWLYRTRQPRFLAEFLLERINDDPARSKIAWEAVRLARQDVVQRGFAGPGTGSLEQAAEVLGDLVEVEARLRAIASAATTGKIPPN